LSVKSITIQHSHNKHDKQYITK